MRTNDASKIDMRIINDKGKTVEAQNFPGTNMKLFDIDDEASYGSNVRIVTVTSVNDANDQPVFTKASMTSSEIRKLNDEGYLVLCKWHCINTDNVSLYVMLTKLMPDDETDNVRFIGHVTGIVPAVLMVGPDGTVTKVS